jgi:hypothetical protein
MVMTLHQFSQIGWREIYKKVKKAVVYIDNEGAECLHWNGGMTQMITAGALTVKEFSTFEVQYLLTSNRPLFMIFICSYHVMLIP